MIGQIKKFSRFETAQQFTRTAKGAFVIFDGTDRRSWVVPVDQMQHWINRGLELSD